MTIKQSRLWWKKNQEEMVRGAHLFHGIELTKNSKNTLRKWLKLKKKYW